MADSRECAQCGALFAPAREHARFCSARCRVTWNRQNAGASGTGNGVLDWSVTAMRDTTKRLLRARSLDRPAGYAMVTEAVWWCTMVEATLVRYHPDARAAALSRRDAAGRQVIEDTFAGLRYVRNQMGYKADPGDFVEAAESDGRPGGQVAAWTWKHIPRPGISGLPGPAREWELTRYLAYQAALADRGIGDTFSQAADFLAETAGISQAHGPVTAVTPYA
jgi:hypothetical protein